MFYITAGILKMNLSLSKVILMTICALYVECITHNPLKKALIQSKQILGISIATTLSFNSIVNAFGPTEVGLTIIRFVYYSCNSNINYIIIILLLY